jgi:hypothetical protein
VRDEFFPRREIAAISAVIAALARPGGAFAAAREERLSLLPGLEA